VNICSPRSAVTTVVILRFAQPAEQAAQLGAQDARVLEPAEQRFDGVEHHAPGADLLDGVVEAHEQALEVVFAGLLDLGAVDVHVVDRAAFSAAQLVEVVAERAHVGRQLLGVFLERDNTPGSENDSAPFTRKLTPEQGFSGAGTARHERGSAGGRPPKVISSSPDIPVGAFQPRCFEDFSWACNQNHLRC
jgi:hypothetical protein